jgi:type II secretory pathway pseudopilin PulG
MNRRDAQRACERLSDNRRSDAGTTLIELMVAVLIFAVVIGITTGTLALVQQQTNHNITSLQATEAGMVGLNKAALEVRDMSDSYDNPVQTADTGSGDIVVMQATEIEFLSGNNIVSNDASGIIDANNGGAGSFTTGCANEIEITLQYASGTAKSGTLVQMVTPPVVPTTGATAGECTWPGPAQTTTLIPEVKPLCAGSPCLTVTSAGATLFSYLQGYPNETVTATAAAQVGEVAIGLAVPAQNGSSQVTPVVLTQTVRLGAVTALPT